jgi:sec-independent protein translocase protein TatA
MEGAMALPHMGPLEIGLIVLVILIIFGAGKLPQVGGAIGKGLRAFRRGQHGEEDEDEEKTTKPEKKVTKKTTKTSKE